MPRRRKRQEEHTNHEAWAIPYGDLITLLLAFFVVMYALSSVNEGKFRVLSESLSAAFRGTPMAPEPIQVGSLARALHTSPAGDAGSIIPMDVAIPRVLLDSSDFDGLDPDAGGMSGDEGLREDELREAARGMSLIADLIQRAVAPLIDADLIRMRREHFWVEVEINTSLLFASGSAEIFPEARPVLDELSGILEDLPVRVHVEGFTDDVPISTAQFPSNWELSAARASSVLRLLVENGLDPTTMAAIGFGEYRPIADNETPEGRRQNRRVTIVILADHAPRLDRRLDPGALRDDGGRTLPAERGRGP